MKAHEQCLDGLLKKAVQPSISLLCYDCVGLMVRFALSQISWTSLSVSLAHLRKPNVHMEHPYYPSTWGPRWKQTLQRMPFGHSPKHHAASPLATAKCCPKGHHGFARERKFESAFGWLLLLQFWDTKKPGNHVLSTASHPTSFAMTAGFQTAA